VNTKAAALLSDKQKAAHCCKRKRDAAFAAASLWFALGRQKMSWVVGQHLRAMLNRKNEMRGFFAFGSE